MILLNIGSRIEELFLKFWINFIAAGFLVITSCVFATDISYLETLVVEDFEQSIYSKKNLKRFPPDIALPEISMSHLVIAPVPGSTQSMFIHLPEYLEMPTEINLNIPFVVNDYGEKLIFNVHSSGFDGTVYVVIENFSGEKLRYKITHLNFIGWKEISFTIKNLLNQNDYMWNHPKSFSITGVVIEQGKYTKGKDNVVGFDDIFLVKRKKLLVPLELEKLF